jgi:hypothetical protein
MKEEMSVGDLDGQVLAEMLLSMPLWWRRRLHMHTALAYTIERPPVSAPCESGLVSAKGLAVGEVTPNTDP